MYIDWRTFKKDLRARILTSEIHASANKGQIMYRSFISQRNKEATYFYAREVKIAD